MKPVLHCAVMLVVVLFGMPGYAMERLVPYDDFNATQINPNRWFGGEFGTAFPPWSTESIRQLQDPKLRLMYRSYGSTNATHGSQALPIRPMSSRHNQSSSIVRIGLARSA